jgi:ketosteroid isomerase-like protein
MKESAMNDDLQDFQQFMKEREAASQAYVQGDAKPLSHIVALALPATFFAPTGGSTQGAEDVASRYEKDAKAFEQGSNFDFEIFQMAASNEVAYWAGLMRGKARMRGKPEAIPMTLRVTEIFRRENGSWKMVHRHADPLTESKKP